MNYGQKNTVRKLKSFSGIRITEFIELFFYLFVTFILVYFVDVKLNRLIFLIVLPIAWFTKRDYLWIAFFFILMEMPGGLFSGGTKEDPYRLPVYVLAPGISFTINELFILLIFAKSLFNKKITYNYIPPYFWRVLKLLFWLFITLILISPLSGMSFDSMSNVFKLSLTLTMFYSLFRLINTEEQLLRFLKIIFPFAFVALALQIYGLINGEQLISLVKPGVKVVQGAYTVEGPKDWIRPIEMGHTMLITFTGSLFLLMTNRHNLMKQYLVSVNLISFLVILLSGTRSWFIAFSSVYIIFFFLASKKTLKLIISSIFVILLVVLLISRVSVINEQLKNALSRFATVEKVMEGDITGGGTISRYDVRAPRVMEGFLSSSIILGAGFSDHFYKYADGHVGYHNMLLNAGIAGFLLFIYSVIMILRRPFLIVKKFKHINKQLLTTSIFPLIILLIINTGTQTIGFTLDEVNRIILIVYSLLIIDMAVKITVKNSLQQENLL